ncbi:MAG: TMEM175 family protein [Ginsengibacter sp.]
MSKEIFLEKFRRNERVIFLSDGVFAIVLTLLILDIKLPPSLPDDISASELWQQVKALKHHFLSFLLSFVFIINIWFTHNQLLKAFEKVDNAMVWLNNLLLLMTCVIPFPTALIGQYFDNPIGIIFLGSILVFIPLVIYSIATLGYKRRYLSVHFDLHRIHFLRKSLLFISLFSAIPLTFAWFMPRLAFSFYMVRLIVGVVLSSMVKVKDRSVTGHLHNLQGK